MIRGEYKLKNFKQTDKGTFTQRLINFNKVLLTFKGKKNKIKFELTQRGKIKDNNWLKIVS